MGQRGPKPTPTPLLKLRGSWRGPARAGEPAPEVECPPCPAWVTGAGAEHWPEIVEMLAGLNVMARPHTAALALMVDALADWIKFAREAETAPTMVAGSAGNQVANPIFAMKGKAWGRVLQALREFGMTPAALTGVKSIPQKEERPKGLSGFKLSG